MLPSVPRLSPRQVIAIGHTDLFPSLPFEAFLPFTLTICLHLSDGGKNTPGEGEKKWQQGRQWMERGREIERVHKGLGSLSITTRLKDSFKV